MFMPKIIDEKSKGIFWLSRKVTKIRRLNIKIHTFEFIDLENG